MGSISYSNHKLPFLSDEDIQDAKTINEEVIKILNKQKREDTGFKGIFESFIKTGNCKDY